MQVDTSRYCPPRSSGEAVGASPSSPGKSSSFADSASAKPKFDSGGFLVHAKIIQCTPELCIFALCCDATEGLQLCPRFSESGWSRRAKKSFSLVFWGSTGRMAFSTGAIFGWLQTTLPSHLHQNRHHSRHIQKNYPVEPGPTRNQLVFQCQTWTKPATVTVLRNTSSGCLRR